MSFVTYLGAVQSGLIYALVALGVFLSFRVLNFPDLTVDGSFPLGGATAASLIVMGVHPLLATAAALATGAMAGLVTAWLNVRFRFLHLLAGILTMFALYSVNIRIMGAPNIPMLNQYTIVNLFSWTSSIPGLFGAPLTGALKIAVPKVAALLVVVVLAALILGRFLRSEFGLAMRATGANARMARAQGVSTGFYIYVGMAVSNALVALAGAMFAQTTGFADVTLGSGTIVAGLAAVILGETLLPTRSVFLKMLACIIGAVVYRTAIALALEAGWLGLRPSDLNLVTAVLVGVALMLPNVRNPLKSLLSRSA